MGLAVAHIRKLVFVLCSIAFVMWFSLAYLTLAPSTFKQYYIPSDINAVPADEQSLPYRKYVDEVRTGSMLTQSVFVPFILRECTRTTPKYYAPCLKAKLQNAVFGEEMIYPAFVLSPPLFASTRPQDKDSFRKVAEGISERAQRREDGSMVYKEQHGQTYIFENVTLSGNTVFDSWSASTCMSPATSTRNIVPMADGATIQIASAILANSPDSAYFQHFLDRVTHVLGQTAHLRKPAFAITGFESHNQKTVQDVWSMLGFDHEHVLHRQVGKSIGRLLWSCRAPLVHPHSSFTFQRLLNLTSSAPMAQRKAVVYMGRSNSSAANGGRQVLNEDDVLQKISAVLQQRNQSEELVIWDRKAFESTPDMIGWVHSDVAAVIGPHGGALYNHMWASQDTLVLEFQPHGFQSMIFYEGAKTLDQKYAVMHLASDPQDDNNNMQVDLDALEDLLSTHLGTPVPASQKVKTSYSWELDETYQDK